MRTLSGLLLVTATTLVGCHSGKVGAPDPTGGGSPVPEAGGSPAPGAGGYVAPIGHVESFSYLGRLGDYYDSPGDTFTTSEDAPTRMVFCPRPPDGDFGASCIQSVTLDGRPASLTDLKDGQIVEIHGTRIEPPGAVLPNSGYAGVSIDIRRAVVGPVEAIDANHFRLTVLGQQVYAYAGIATDVALGDLVTVSGHFNADGEILAEFIEPYVGDSQFVVRGVLNDTALGGFALGGLEIDLSAASREGFPGGAPLPGDAVVVFAEQPPDEGILTANAVRCTGQCATASWENGWVAGFVTAWRSPTDFDVDGIAVQPSWCQCVYGAPPDIGRYVYVSLYHGNADVTPAPTTSFRTGLAGRIEAIDEVRREITVLGFPVQMSPATLIAATQENYYDFAGSLSLSDLQLGDAVEVGGEVAGNVVVAGRIVPGSEASFVLSYDYTLDRPAIHVAERTILTETTTTITSCDGLQNLSFDDFFATQYMAIFISVDPVRSPLAAVQINACTLADR
jgi:Domain of unknown function (DUF5666)